MSGTGRLQRFERKLERAIVGTFAKAFRAEVQPVEIASAVRRAMDDRATAMTKGRTFVPNRYTVELSQTDYERLTAYAADVEAELRAAAEEHADSQRYTLKGAVSLQFALGPQLETGIFRIHPGGIGTDKADRSPAQDAPPASAVKPGEVVKSPAAVRPGEPVKPAAALRSAAAVGEVWDGHSAAPLERAGDKRRGEVGDHGEVAVPASAPSGGHRDDWVGATRLPGAGVVAREDWVADHDGRDDPTFGPSYGESYRPPGVRRSGDRPVAPVPPGWPGAAEESGELPAQAVSRPVRPPSPPREERRQEPRHDWRHESPRQESPMRQVRPSARPYLEIDGERYPLLGPMTVVGRDTIAGVVLEDANASRRHCEIRVTSDGPHLVANVRDLGSTNGTHVNGARITSQRLHDGDEIVIGQTTMVFHAGPR